MQADPPKAEPPKRKRRWFQFRLRTLMIVVTLLATVCAYVSWQMRIVRERQAEVNREVEGRIIGTDDVEKDNPVPWIRRLLGDQCVLLIWMPLGTDPAELDRLRALFPEALVETRPVAKH
jgi:hypothetical protein